MRKPFSHSSTYPDCARAIALAVSAATRAQFGTEVDDALVTKSPPRQPGDFQSSLAMKIAKASGKDPQGIAHKLASALSDSHVFEPPTVSGRGFLNFRLREDFILQSLLTMAQDPRCGIAEVSQPRRIVVDYSGPNVAKEMHVGHLRSTILGDTLCRIFGFLGHDVIA
jgi:arginyl-tRNA synthetase